MNKNSQRDILVRYFLISISIIAFAGFIIAALFRTTVIDAEKWNAKAMQELSRVDTILPTRGDILADDGSVLATNLRYYTVRIDFRSERFMSARYLSAIDSIADSLATYFPIRSKADWAAYLHKPMLKDPDKRPRAYKLLSNISYSQYQHLRTFPFFSIPNANRNGITVEKRMRRSNPYGDMARRSIGGVGEQSNRQIRGISGLEKALDSLLYGTPGVAKKIPLTRRIVNWTDVPPVPGYDIRTTIDINIQDLVENELNQILETCDADWGVAVLMDVATGDIKAISNLEKSPSGSRYIEGMNRAVLGFEPGSVIKPVSMLIALEKGLVNSLDEVIPIGQSYAYGGGRAITDSHYNSALTVRGVIEESSNIGMTRIITRPNGPFHNHPEEFYKALSEIGFLDPMMTGIAGERTPMIPRKPSRVTLSRMCYGYATEVPPLYTLSIYNAIANGGRYVRPRLVKELIGAEFDSVLPVTYVRDRICSEKNAAKLRDMLRSVVWGDRGTARHFVRDENVEIAGKTGTCYMIENGAYNTSKKRLAFCGFFPAESPRYSCIVLTCHPRQNLLGAASTSGQVVRNIARKMFSRGMLGNTSDYRAEVTEGTRPSLYYSADDSRARHLKRGLEVAEVTQLRPRSESGTPQASVQAARGVVPQVTGLGLREAIVAIENSGFDVAFSGTGYVSRQTPLAGSSLSPGSTVHIRLSEH